MRNIILFLLLTLTSFSTYADILDRCELITNKPDLQHEMNKRAICNATFHAIFEANIRNYDYFLRITANGYQRMYSVQLNKIEAFIGNDLVERTSGVLKWDPNGEEVVLD